MISKPLKRLCFLPFRAHRTPSYLNSLNSFQFKPNVNASFFQACHRQQYQIQNVKVRVSNVCPSPLCTKVIFYVGQQKKEIITEGQKPVEAKITTVTGQKEQNTKKEDEKKGDFSDNTDVNKTKEQKDNNIDQGMKNEQPLNKKKSINLQKNKLIIQIENLVPGIVVGILILVIGQIIYDYVRIWLNKKKVENKIQRLCGSNQYIQELPYFVQTSTDTQMEDLLNDFQQKSFKYLVGVPGKGKTTSVRQVIKKLRKQNKHKIYYVSLKMLEKNQITEGKPGLTHQQFNELLDHILERKERFPKMKFTLIVDDINDISNIYPEEKEQINLQKVEIYRKMGAILGKERGNVILISSETIKEQDVKRNPVAKRAFEIQIVQPKTKTEIQKAMLSIMYFKYNIPYAKNKLEQELNAFKNTGQVIEKEQQNERRVILKVVLNAAETNCSLRFLENIRCQKIDQLESQFQKKKQQQIYNFKQALVQMTTNLHDFFKNEKKRELSIILRQLLKMRDDKIQIRDCRSIIQILDKEKIRTQGKQLLQRMDKANMHMYCHPRSNLARTAIELYIKQNLLPID